MEFYNTVEQTLINGALPYKYESEDQSNEPIRTADVQVQDKKLKVDYLALQILFVDKLKYLSLNLKGVPISERTTAL